MKIQLGSITIGAIAAMVMAGSAFAMDLNECLGNANQKAELCRSNVSSDDPATTSARIDACDQQQDQDQANCRSQYSQ
jgi:hypothetical protein